MSFTVTHHSLSALAPVKFSYTFKEKSEQFASEKKSFSGGFDYYHHKAAENYLDAAISNGNCILLTDEAKPAEIFVAPKEPIGSLSYNTTFKLSYEGIPLRYKDDRLFVGGTGSDINFNIIVETNGQVRLDIGENKHVQVSASYPYELVISDEPNTSENLPYRTFDLFSVNGNLSFRTKTSEGYRYVSFTEKDKVVRAVGLALNEVVVNPIYFVPEFIAVDQKSALALGLEYITREVRYKNGLTDFIENDKLIVDTAKESNTNLLVVCTTKDVSENTEVAANVSLLKTNFTEQGTYSTNEDE